MPSGVVERAIEGWLSSASETSFEIPFRQILTSRGYTVLHKTRHQAMELGKDIIAIDPDGRLCAFQLKGTTADRITLAKWRSDVQPQVQDLVMGEVTHPSVKQGTSHQAYIVTNKDLDEPVWHSIRGWNAGQTSRRQPTLQVIVGGQLLQWAKEASQSYWPVALEDTRLFLELHLARGNGQMPIEQLLKLLSVTLPIDADETPAAEKFRRAATGAALMCSFAIAPFAEQANHYAEIEAWTVFVALVLSIAERWSLPESAWGPTVAVGMDAIEGSLALLADEALRAETFVEGDELVDYPFIRARRSLLAAIVSCFVLWNGFNGQNDPETTARAREFVQANGRDLALWGEAAVAQRLITYWFMMRTTPTHEPYAYLSRVAKAVAQAAHPEARGLASPYYRVQDRVQHMIDPSGPMSGDNFRGQSYTLKSLLHLCARSNYKQDMSRIWPAASYAAFEEVTFEDAWRFLLWRSDTGCSVTEVPPMRMSWSELRDAASDGSGSELPRRLLKFPHFALVFLLVFPHRLTPSFTRWLDTKVRGLDRLRATV